MAEYLPIIAGLRCAYRGQPVIVRQVLDLTHIVVETGAGKAVIVAPQHLQLLPSQNPVPQERDTYQFMGKEAQRTALARYAIIQPFLQQRLSPLILAKTLAQHQISEATLRRWLRAYRRAGLTGLLKHKSAGGRQQSRLPQQREQVLQGALQHYLSLQRPSLEHVYKTLCMACARQQMAPPALTTLRRRIAHLPTEERIRRRQGAQVAREQCEPLRSSTLQPAYPLEVVEVDHALLNIILLDEHTNQPVGRPWLTVALDVYSRMVVGFYLSLEQPGASATGLCLAHAILPKETWLAHRNIEGEWPCWGVMHTLHLDNAKEFHGRMLLHACEQYQIQVQYRPAGRPQYGGHVERLIRTLKYRIRHAPGAYFSDRKQRRTYRPHAQAIFTLPAFEKWLTHYLIQVYHQRVHSTLGTSPAHCYEQGMLVPGGRGLPPRPTNERQVQLDFMPFVERTIQRYGVVIGHLHYYDHVLRPYIGRSTEGPHSASSPKYVFRTDPRDLSCIYFLDPVTRVYHPIPLADLRQGAFSAHTRREALRRVRSQQPPAARLQEKQLFAAMQELHQQEQHARRQLTAQGRLSRRPTSRSHRRLRQEAMVQRPPAPKSAAPEQQQEKAAIQQPPATTEACPSLPHVRNPFPDLDDGASHLLDR